MRFWHISCCFFVYIYFGQGILHNQLIAENLKPQTPNILALACMSEPYIPIVWGDFLSLIR